MIKLFTEIKILDKDTFQRKTHHWSGSLTHQSMMSLPDLLIIVQDVQSTKGFYLYRYTKYGEFCGDTWHPDLEQAKNQAIFEYGESLEKWKEIPGDLEDVKKFIKNFSKKN